jgi:hypothetical protein
MPEEVVRMIDARNGSVVHEPDRLGDGARDRAMRRIIAELEAGLRHGYFEYTVTCEVIGHGRRRLVLHAGKSYQFVIPADECAMREMVERPSDEGAGDPRP